MDGRQNWLSFCIFPKVVQCVSLFFFFYYHFEFELIFIIRGPLNLCVCGPCLNCQITWLSRRQASRGVTPAVSTVPGCLTPAAYIIFSAGRVHHDELRYQQPLWRNPSSSREPLTHLWIKCNKSDYGETTEDINAQRPSFQRNLNAAVHHFNISGSCRLCLPLNLGPKHSLPFRI